MLHSTEYSQSDDLSDDVIEATPNTTPRRTIGRFELVETLGQGQMGVAWKAYDPTREDFVVVKILPAELQQDSQELAQFKHSFICIQKLQHPYICPVYDLGDDEETGCFLVTKFLPLGTLDEYIGTFLSRHKQITADEAVRVLRPIAEALDYAHSQGVVHRDLKPANILVSEAGDDVQLIDFGLAAHIRTGLSRDSQEVAECADTLAYMAPEQWQCREVNGRTDQYALSVLLYELLAGRLPFESMDATVMRRCVLEEPVEAIPGLPLSVNLALAKGLAKDPNDRFRSCVELLECMMRQDSCAPNILGSAKPLPDVLAIADPIARVRAAGELMTVLLRSILPKETTGVDLRDLNTLIERALAEDQQRAYFLTVSEMELANEMKNWRILQEPNFDATSLNRDVLLKMQSAWTRAINDLLPHASEQVASAARNSARELFPRSVATNALAQRIGVLAQNQFFGWRRLSRRQRLLRGSIGFATIILLTTSLPTVSAWLSPRRAATVARTAAEDERKIALQAGADRKAPGLFQPAEVEFQTQGIRRFDSRDFRAARIAFDHSKSGFKKARILAGQVASCETARVAAQASLTAANNANGAVRCPDKWADTRKSFDAAEGYFAGALYQEAEIEFRRTQAQFDEIAREASAMITAEEKATRSLESARMAFNDAELAEAARNAPAVWRDGQDNLRAAEHSFSLKEFRAADQQAIEAKKLFSTAHRDAQIKSRHRNDAQTARVVLQQTRAEAEQARAKLAIADQAESAPLDEQAMRDANAKLAKAESDWDRQDYLAAHEGFLSAQEGFKSIIIQAEKERPHREATTARRAARSAREVVAKINSTRLDAVKQWQDGEIAMRKANNSYEQREFAAARSEFERAESHFRESEILVNLLQEIDRAEVALKEVGVEESYLNQHGGEIWNELKQLIHVVRTTSDFNDQQRAAERVRRVLPDALNIGRVVGLFKLKKYDEALDLLLTSWPQENDPNRIAMFNSCARFVPNWWWSQIHKLAAGITDKNEQFLLNVMLAIVNSEIANSPYAEAVKKVHENSKSLTDPEFKFDGLMALARAQKAINDKEGVAETLKSAEHAANLLAIQRRQLAGWEFQETLPAKAMGFAQIAGLYRWLGNAAEAERFELSAHRLVEPQFGAQATFLNQPNEHFQLILMADSESLPKRDTRAEAIRQGQFTQWQSQFYANQQTQSYRTMSATLALRSAELGLSPLYITAKSAGDDLNRETNQETIGMLFFRANLAEAALKMNDVDDAETLVKQIEQAASVSIRKNSLNTGYLAQAVEIGHAIQAEIQARKGSLRDVNRILDGVTCEKQSTITNRFSPVHRGLMAYRVSAKLMASKEKSSLFELYDWAKSRPSSLTRIAAVLGLLQALEKPRAVRMSDSGMKTASHSVTSPIVDEQMALDEIAFSQIQHANDHFLIGVTKYKAEDWNAAHDEFCKALNLDPGFKSALKLRAVCHLRLRKVAAAVHDAKVAQWENWKAHVVLSKEGKLMSGSEEIAKLPRGRWVEISDIKEGWLKVNRYLDTNGKVQSPEYAWIKDTEFEIERPAIHQELVANSRVINNISSTSLQSIKDRSK